MFVLVRRLTLVCAAVSAALLLSAVAQAQGTQPGAQKPGKADTKGDAVLAQGLFEAGLTLMDAGKYSEACPKFEQSQRLSPTGGTLMNIALCHEKDGKLATASVDYDAALAQALKDGRTERQQFARKRIAELALLVPRMIVVLDPSDQDAEVQVDDRPLPNTALGEKLPLDPGPHTVQVRAPGRIASLREITLKIGDVQTVTIDKLALSPGKQREVPQADAPLADTRPGGALPTDKKTGVVVSGLVPQAQEGSTSYERQEQSIAVPILWASGAVMLAAGSVASLAAVVNWVNYKNNCLSDRNFCRNQEGKDAGAGATRWGWVGTVGLIVGAATWVVIPLVPKRTVRVGLSSVSFEGTF